MRAKIVLKWGLWVKIWTHHFLLVWPQTNPTSTNCGKQCLREYFWYRTIRISRS